MRLRGRLACGTDFQLHQVQELVRSAVGAAPTKALFLKALHQHGRDPRTPQVPPPTLQFPAGDAVGNCLQNGRPFQQALFNIALLWSAAWSREQVLDGIMRIAESGDPILAADHHSSHINRFNAAVSEGNRAAARDVLRIAIARLVTAIHDKHSELHSLASQLEWKPMLDFICLLPGYGPFWANKLAYDLRRAGLARCHPRDRLSYCLWGLVPGACCLPGLGPRPSASMPAVVALCDPTRSGAIPNTMVALRA